MNIAQTIGRQVAAADNVKGARDFAKLAHAILKSDGKISKVMDAIERPKTMRESAGLGPLADIFRHGGLTSISRSDLQHKTVVNPNSLGTDTAFRSYDAISNGFLGSLVNAGAFDGMLPSMHPLPLQNATVGYVSTNALAYSLNEMDMKPLSRLSIVSQNSDPLKAVCLVEFTKELVRFGGPGTLALIEGSMRRAVALVTDEKFLSVVSSGVTPNTSTGSTAEAIRADIGAMLTQVTLGQDSKPFIVTNSTVCKRWCMRTDQHGMAAFPELGPQGGSINQIPVLVSDAVGMGLAYLIDAASIGANAGELILTEGQEYTRQGDSVPDSPPSASTSFISVFQLNVVGLRIERFFIAERIRASSVAAVSNVANWAGGESPP
jgi:hypothetical protein